jgi:hypothetical protein
MTRYAISAFCEACSAPHPMGVSVLLADGPSEKASVGEYYAGKTVPPTLMLMARNPLKCPKTGKMFQQWDQNLIFITPIERLPS